MPPHLSIFIHCVASPLGVLLSTSLLMQSMQAYDIQSFAKIMAIFLKIYVWLHCWYVQSLQYDHCTHPVCSVLFMHIFCVLTVQIWSPLWHSLWGWRPSREKRINTITADWKEFAFLIDLVQGPRQRLQRLTQRMHKLREMVYSLVCCQ